MPSGAKKRKAAKKKKEKAEPRSALHGADDLKVHEKKESDGGESNSPPWQDHRDDQHFAEGEDKREEDTSSIQSTITESEFLGVNSNGEISDKVAFEKKDGIQIIREIKLEDDFEPKAVTIEHIDFEKKSSSSSNRSSDDESKFVDKNTEVIIWEEPIEYAPDLPAEVAAEVDLEKTSDSPEVAQVNEVVSHHLAVVTPNDESYETVSAEGASNISVKQTVLPEVTALTKAIIIVDDHDLVIAKSIVEASDLVSETIPQVEPAIFSKGEISLGEELDLRVNGKSESLDVPSSVVDMGSQSNVDIISTNATEDGGIIPITMTEEDEYNKMLPQSSVPADDNDNGAEPKKDSEIERLDRQTPIALPPRPVQTTSSMGCCGLFELFTGSNR